MDEKQVDEFIEENRPLVQDPDTGQSTLTRVVTQASNLYVELSNDAVEAADRATEAADKLTDAINDPHCPASKVDMKEREYNVLLAEHNRLQEVSRRLEEFVSEASAALKGEKPWPNYPLLDSDDPNLADFEPQQGGIVNNQPNKPTVGPVLGVVAFLGAVLMVCLTVVAIAWILWG